MQEDVTDNIKKVVNENIWGSIKEFLNVGFHFGDGAHQVKISIGNPKLFKNFGFNIDGRYKGSYLWESSIANAVMPEIYVVDAQINYGIPAIKSVIKAGATNLGGNEYQSAVGTGFIGSQYYISLTINN